MGFEEHLVLSRDEIANRLHQIADQIARGSLSVGGIRSTVPETARYQLDFDVDDGERELKIEIEWR